MMKNIYIRSSFQGALLFSRGSAMTPSRVFEALELISCHFFQSLLMMLLNEQIQ